MTTPKTPQPDIRLLLDLKPEFDRYSPEQMQHHLMVTVHVVLSTSEGFRNPGYSHWDEGHEYRELEVHAQRQLGSSDFYPFELTFSRTRTDLHEVEQMVKTLRRLTNKLSKLQEQHGSPPDFADFLNRVSIALGRKTALCFLRKTGGSPRSWSYDEQEYRPMDLDQLRSWLDSEVEGWQTKNGVEKPE